MRPAVLLLLLASALAGCTSSPPAAPPSEGPIVWSFVDTEGRMHSNATAAGQPAVLFFMASWCSSCRAMTQRLAAVHADAAPRGAQFFSVSIERGDDHGVLEQWKQQYRQPWPHGRDEGFALGRAFGIVAQSSVVVLDGQGQVVQQWGYPGASEADVRAAVERAFAA